jgi:hypothetical protein
MSNENRREDCSSSDNNNDNGPNVKAAEDDAVADIKKDENLEEEDDILCSPIPELLGYFHWSSSTSCDRRRSGSLTDSNHCCGDSEKRDDNNNISRSNNVTSSPRMSTDHYCCCGADSIGESGIRCNNINTTTTTTTTTAASPPPSPPNYYSRLRGGKSTTANLNSNCYNTYSSNNITALEAYNRGMLFTYLISNISNHFGGRGSSYCDEYHDASCLSCCSILGGEQNNDDDDPTIPTTSTDLEIKVKKERLERRWSGHQPLVPDTWSSSSCDDNIDIMSPLELRSWKNRRKRGVISSSSSSNSQLLPLLSPVEEIRLASSSFANIRCYPLLLLGGGSGSMEQESPLPLEKQPSVPHLSPKWAAVAQSSALLSPTITRKNSSNIGSIVSSTTTKDMLSHSPPTLSSLRYPIQQLVGGIQHEEEVVKANQLIIDEELSRDDASSSSSTSNSISSMHKIQCSSPRLIHTRQLLKQWMPPGDVGAVED